MTKEQLIAAGLTEEQANAVLAMRGNELTNLRSQIATLTSENEQLQADAEELARIHAENMSAEERVQLALEEAENEKAKALKMQNEIKARETLINGGMEPSEIDDGLLGLLVTDEESTTVERCNSYTSKIKAKLEAQEAKLKEDLLKGVSDPTKPTGDEYIPDKTEQEKLAITLAEQATAQSSGFNAYLKGE